MQITLLAIYCHEYTVPHMELEAESNQHALLWSDSITLDQYIYNGKGSQNQRFCMSYNVCEYSKVKLPKKRASLVIEDQDLKESLKETPEQELKKMKLLSSPVVWLLGLLFFIGSLRVYTGTGLTVSVVF